MPRCRRLLGIALLGLLATGCGTTRRFDGHTYQDVMLAARHVMDRYAAENVVGMEQGVIDWADYDDSAANRAASFVTVGGFAHVADRIRVAVEPTGKREVEVTVEAGDEYLVGWLPVHVLRPGLEEEILDRIRSRLEEMVQAKVREEEDLELRSIGARVEYKSERLAATERAGYGFGRIEEAELDRFSRGRSDVDRHYEQIPEPPRREEGPPPDAGAARTPGERLARHEPPATERPTEPLPEGHARHEFRDWKPEHAERPDGPTPAGMALVPGGEFLAGWSGGEPDERTERTIHVSSFYIDIAEVTNAEYKRFYDDVSTTHDHSRCHPDEPPGRTHRPRFWSRDGLDEFEGPDLPVVGVDWFDAHAYAAWAGKRLPTEMEWEKAARGTDGRRYPWGNDFEARAVNCALSGLQKPSGVHRFELGASPYGVLAMGGNVSEWCFDSYSEDSYAAMPDRDPRNDAPSLGRVLRGGSWKDPRDLVRTTWRNYGRPDRYALYIGFRCAKDPR